MREGILFLGIAAACVAVQPPMLHASDSAEYVYVESNLQAPNSNSIYAFLRGSDGRLTQISGSPFLTGGAGVQYTGFNLGPHDSDQEIIANPQHTLLFAVNSGSDTVAVFHIEENGSLTPVDGSPFPSGGSDPVSLGLDGNTLFIANQSGDFGRPSSLLPNYTAMRVEWDGVLRPIGDRTNDTSHRFQSTVDVANGSSPSQALTVAGSDLLFGADFLGGLLQRFRHDEDGQLHQLPPLSLPATEFTDTTTPRLPLGLWGHPRQPILYVGYVTVNKLGVYRYNEDGALKFLRTVPNAGQGICWIRSNTSGTRLYTSDTSSNQVSVYDTSDPEYPVEIQTLTLEDVGNAFQLSLSDDGKYIYVLSTRATASIPAGQGNVLHTLAVQDDGTVAEIASPVVFSLPTGIRPQGVAVVDMY